MFETQPDALVTLTTVGNLQEAAIYRSLIESEGVRVEMGDEAVATTFPYLTMGISSGVKLLVLQKDVQRAGEILQRALADKSATAAVHEEVSCDPNRSADRAGLLALVAILIPPLILVSIYLLIDAWVRHHQDRHFNRKRFWKNVLFTLIAGGIAGLVMVSLVIPYLIENRY